MKRSDLLWILAYPVYQLIGTLRHEASHAAAAWLEGAEITEFVFWPTDYGWGYVRWEGAVSTLTTAAPYLVDLLTFLCFFALCMTLSFGGKRWLWLNAVVLGMLSPLINSAYNYRYGRGGTHDVGKMLNAWDPALVHGYFWWTFAVYLTGLILVFTRSKTARS